jgi:prephenate dehydratase
MNVAYPGRDGTHSAAACDKLFPGAALVPLPSFAAVAEAAGERLVDFGVLPIESSLVGPVSETHDLLYDSPLSITGETVLPIRHFLVGPETVPLDQVRVVHSHPVALDQCRQLLARMPQATAIAAATTADAAHDVAQAGDPSQVAIASERAASMYGLEVIVADVGDHPEAYTRFVSVSTYLRLDRNGGSPWRTAFSFVTNHEPFGRHRLDMLQLVSRPLPATPWRYRFDTVLAGHPLDPVVAGALEEVAARTRLLKVFGSYPAATG